MNNPDLSNQIHLTAATAFKAMSEDSLQQAREAEAIIGSLPQIAIATDHVLHAGVYTRTVFLPKGSVIAGALIKRSTNIIISGHVIVFIGDDKAKEYKGYAVIAASANRKQVFVAKADTNLTMFFSTKADNIKQAEEEFTNEAENLMSRQHGSINSVTITGE